MEIKFPLLAHDLLDFLKGEGLDAFLVGGAVRDFLMTKKLGEDLDFEVHGPLERFPQTIKAFVESRPKIRGELLPFQIYRLSTDNLILEFSPARREEYFSGRWDHTNFRPHYIPHYKFTESFKRRDFTLNAIGYDYFQKKWIDPFGGMRDLEERLLRPCSKDFIRDPVRYLRAIRFSLNKEMDFSCELKKLLPQMEMGQLSQHYFLTELFKTNNHSAFFRSCREWNSSLPQVWENMARVLNKSQVNVFQDVDHLIYEYFQLGGGPEALRDFSSSHKKWVINFFLTLRKVSYGRWKNLQKLDYDQFKNYSDIQDYLFLFQTLRRYSPHYLFLTSDDKMLLEDLTLRLKIPFSSKDKIHYRERSLYQLYFSGKNSS